jgi:hypothetical protein
LAEGVIAWERLLVEDIDGRFGKFAFSRGDKESGLNDDRPRVMCSQARLPLHERKLACRLSTK